MIKIMKKLGTEWIIYLIKCMPSLTTSTQHCAQDITQCVLARRLSWLERRPVAKRLWFLLLVRARVWVAASVSSPGTYDPRYRCTGRAQPTDALLSHRYFSLSLSLKAMKKCPRVRIKKILLQCTEPGIFSYVISTNLYNHSSLWGDPETRALLSTLLTVPGLESNKIGSDPGVSEWKPTHVTISASRRCPPEAPLWRGAATVGDSRFSFRQLQFLQSS